MMCEIPTQRRAGGPVTWNIFDGMSIGSNDLTQLTLGARPGLGPDRAAVRRARRRGRRPCSRWRSTACRKAGKYIGICGQGPSDHPDLARWLLDQGIESLSLNPDSVVETWLFLANEAKA